MARIPRALPAALTHAPFRVDQALALGVDRERLRRSDLVTPARGVRVAASQDGFLSRALALGLLLRPDQYLSHTTAARLWGCPLPRRSMLADSAQHVTTIGDGPVERRTGVVGHRIAAARADVSRTFGTQTSSPAASWYECRSLLTVRELVVLGDHLIGVGRLTSIDHLAERIRPGDRGVVAARSALDLIRPGSESPMETIVRLIVVEAGFPEPLLNVDVHDGAGRFIGRVDLGWPHLRVAIEYDGDHHRTDRATFDHDRTRGNAFTVEQWLVIHVTAPDVRRPAPFLERLRQAFATRLGR